MKRRTFLKTVGTTVGTLIAAPALAIPSEQKWIPMAERMPEIGQDIVMLIYDKYVDKMGDRKRLYGASLVQTQSVQRTAGETEDHALHIFKKDFSYRENPHGQHYYVGINIDDFREIGPHATQQKYEKIKRLKWVHKYAVRAFMCAGDISICTRRMNLNMWWIPRPKDLNNIPDYPKPIVIEYVPVVNNVEKRISDYWPKNRR